MTAILLMLVAVLSTQGAWAAPVLNLPTDPVTATYGGWLAGQNSTIDVTLGDVGSGFDVSDRTYPGWCVQDYVLESPTSDDTARLYSTYDPNLPSGAQGIAWSKINYVLNHKQGNDDDVQIAIWFLKGDPVPSSLGDVTPDAKAMIEGADANPDYVPGPGDVMAVLVYTDGMFFDPETIQETIIEVPVPEPEKYTLGDRVWYDQNQNGIQDPNEPGYNGATVDLYDDATCTGTLMASTTTGATGPAGFYEFTDLLAGDYCVQFGNIPAGWSISPADQGDGTNDSSANGSAQIPGIHLMADDPHEDMGIYVPGSLGDSVVCVSTGQGLANIGVSLFEDFDGNGIPDGSAIATTETDSSGFYQFTGLQVALAGDLANLTQYIVEVDVNDADLGVCNVPVPPTEYNPPLDSNNPNDSNNDFSFEKPPLGSIGDTVWQDDNGDGLQDPGEPGIPGVTVNLRDPGPDGQCGTGDDVWLASDVTDANGNYLFTDLPQGTYCVDSDETTVPAGYLLTTNNDPEKVDLGPGENFLDADFGYQPRYTLGDRVWYDQDQDGIQDANEPGYNGATVDLYDDATCSGTLMASTTTGVAGPDGFYEFTGLLAGDYCVQFGNIPAGWSISPADQGDGTNDSSANGSAQIPNIGLTADDPDEDMGIYVPGSLGDSVVCANTGQGLANIGVSLFEDFDCDTFADGPAIASTDTGAAGFYAFTGLEVALAGDPVNQTCYIVAVDDTDLDLGTCNTPIPPTEYNPPLDSDNPDDLTNDFLFEELICSLEVNKTCQLPPPPPTSFVCSDAKPVDELTMIWNGAQPVDVVAWKGSVGSTVVGTVENVLPGDVVTISGFAGSPNDVYWEIFGAASGVKLGESTFHLSCSDDGMNGPEDCGLPEGDGKDKTGFLNDWLFEGMAGNGQELICTPTPPAPAEACEFTLGPNPSCETLDRPTSLTFELTGGTCSDGLNSQGDKFKCTDYAPIDPTQPVEVVYVGKDPDKFAVMPGLVSIGEQFSIDTSRSEFHSETKLELYQGGALVQFLNIHTSCSAPLAVGDEFASLRLVAFNDQRAGNEVTYFYEVTNTGDALANVFLTDLVNGQPIFSDGPILLLQPGDTASFENTTDIFETTTNTATFSGLLANNKMCMANDSVTVEVFEPCAECKGGTTEITFQYLGSSSYNVVVYDKSDDSDANKILFQGLVEPDDQFTITPRPGQDKLENDISIYVDGLFHAKIHTSCSKPIGPNAVYGDFLVVEGRSKDNGLMCPLNACAPQPTDSLVFDGDKFKWVVTNAGDLGLEVERVSIDWPAAFGNLVEMKVNGTFFKGSLPPTSAVVEGSWEGNVDDRTIKPGETKTFEFKFANDVSLVGDVNIVVDFTAGCPIEVSYQAPFSGGDFACDKPIDALTMIWDAANTVDVTAWKGSVGSTNLGTVSNVMTGKKVTFAGFAGSPNDVYWEIFDPATGAKLGESTFHLSCSDDAMNGPEDCGSRQGNGKSNDAGLVNDWLLDGMVDAKTALMCTVSP